MSDPPRIPGFPTHIRLIEPLGAGTTSTVWRARDRATGLDVAVKLVEDRPGGPRAAERVEREGRALARIGDHPGILTVLAVGLGEDRTTGWIVTPLVDGRPLDEAVDPLSCDDALVFGASAADALAHAHRLGVAHGDLSPSNVFVDSDGSAVLGDFGLATLDRPASPAGFTPAFAAPERRRGGAPTPAADVYSLGAVLWWAHTRQVAPPVGTSQPATSQPHTSQPWLHTVVDACLRTDPADRPSAADVAALCRRPPPRGRAIGRRSRPG